MYRSIYTQGFDSTLFPMWKMKKPIIKAIIQKKGIMQTVQGICTV